MSTKSNSNKTTPQAQLTRRDILKALAILPAAALPTLPKEVCNEMAELPESYKPAFEPITLDPIPQTAEALVKRLSDLAITMAVIPPWLHFRLNGGQEIDPVKVLKQFDEAYAAAEEYQRLILTNEFEDLLLKPLCGGPERFTEIMNTWPDADEATREQPGKGYQDRLDIAIIAIDQAAKV